MKLIWLGSAALTALCFATPPDIAQAEERRPNDRGAVVVQSIDKSEREIARLATEVANSRRFFEEDYGWIEITARYDVATGVLSLDPGSRFGPISGFHEMEDLHSNVYEAVVAVADRMPHFKRIDWVYGGFDLYHWFPQDTKPQRAAPFSLRSGRSGAPVLVSAGHGYYFNHGYKDWRAQRDAHNGILEDGITITFADLLISELFIGGVESISARNAAFKFHEPSKQPYHMIAARYQLEELIPDRPDIWHSLPTATHALREYDEDIRSRPLYANYIGASELRLRLVKAIKVRIGSR